MTLDVALLLITGGLFLAAIGFEITTIRITLR